MHEARVRYRVREGRELSFSGAVLSVLGSATCNWACCGPSCLQCAAVQDTDPFLAWQVSERLRCCLSVCLSVCSFRSTSSVVVVAPMCRWLDACLVLIAQRHLLLCCCLRIQRCVHVCVCACVRSMGGVARVLQSRRGEVGPATGVLAQRVHSMRSIAVRNPSCCFFFYFLVLAECASRLGVLAACASRLRTCCMWRVQAKEHNRKYAETMKDRERLVALGFRLPLAVITAIVSVVILVIARYAHCEVNVHIFEDAAFCLFVCWVWCSTVSMCCSVEWNMTPSCVVLQVGPEPR